MKNIYIHNNSIKDEYYKQTNNERDPFIACFPTSLINLAKGVLNLTLPTSKEKTGGFKQPEDGFDWYMHNSPEVKEWVDNYCKTLWVRDYLKKGGDIRELWEVEVYCFNKWMGYECVKLNYNMSKLAIIEEIQRGRGVVTTGKFVGFSHAVCIVGFKAEMENLDKDINFSGDNISFLIDNDSIKNVTHIIIDDSYGNPLENYKPVGVNGNDVYYPKNDFFKAINKADSDNTELFYGIVAVPN